MVAILNLIWVPIVAFADIAIPDKILTLPIIAAFVVSLVHFVALYRLRVPSKAGQMLGAMIAAMSVQWTVSRAVAQGLITEHLPFARTSKGGLSRMSIEFQAFWEAVIGVLLLVGAAVLVVTNSSKQVREIYIFAGVLVLESLPFLSAVAIAILENSRINSFAFWRNSAVRTAELIGLRPVAMPTVGRPLRSRWPPRFTGKPVERRLDRRVAARLEEVAANRQLHQGNSRRSRDAFAHRRAIDPQRARPLHSAASERVAQAVEHVTFNHGVEGSSPSALTMMILLPQRFPELLES